MSFQIISIIVYGYNGKVRTVPFRLNDVNIITGKSKTGKTAMTHVIDYCLGRNTCNIAMGVIRKSVAWYAIHLQFPSLQVFVARRNPEPDANTNPEIQLESANEITVPTSAAELKPNISEDGLVDALDRFLGITPNEHVPPAGQTRRSLRASASHAKLFCFQGQSEIFDPDTLFHRQKEDFMTQTIKDTLPYFIGAVPDTSLLVRERLRLAKQELGRLVREKAEAERIAGEGESRATSLLSEAAEVGLVKADEHSDPRSQLVALQNDGFTAMDRRSYDFGEEAIRLRTELGEVRQLFQEVQRQTQAATDFNNAGSLFEVEARSQIARLDVVGIIPNNQSDNHVCPLCESKLEEDVPAASEIRKSLRRLQRELKDVGTNRPRVDVFLNRLRARQQTLRQRMTGLRQQLNGIESQNQSNRNASGLERQQAVVMGRISLYLENAPKAETTTLLGKRIALLEAEITGLESQLQVDDIREALDSALSRISLWMTAGAQALGLEYQPNPHRLDLSVPTVVADSDARPVRMKQMGSAANWLGCHLIVHVALQKWFASKNRPVPRFLFLDQPTSAYYPPDDSKTETDDDRLAVRQMYRWLIDAVQQADEKEKFQLIIVDHADLKDEWFQSCVVERWRGDNALIPKDWLTGPDPSASEAPPDQPTPDRADGDQNLEQA